MFTRSDRGARFGQRTFRSGDDLLHRLRRISPPRAKLIMQWSGLWPGCHVVRGGQEG